MTAPQKRKRFDDASEFLGFENASIHEKLQYVLIQEEQDNVRDQDGLEDFPAGLRRSARSNIGDPPYRFGESIGLATVVMEEPVTQKPWRVQGAIS